jgi:CubicO group peptidase (beta-lactamase class C family)
LNLAQPVVELLPEFQGSGKSGVNVGHLLAHSSGLASWQPLYREVAGWPGYVARIASLELSYAPGTQTVYSDLGFILLGAAIERLTGEPWQKLVERRALAPLELNDTIYCPPKASQPRVAPTEECAWRGRLLSGEVHDENAAALGGVAPHAGLFASAGDVARFARAILAGGTWRGRQIVSKATLARFAARVAIPGSTRALGWDTPNDSGYSTAGQLLSRSSIGHTGFTGTSLWIDQECGLFVGLLSNRVYPTRHNDAIRWVRAALADAVVRDLTGV